MSGDDVAREPEILFTREGRAGIITLNRPKALNALTLGMVRAMHPQLIAWADDPDVELVIVEAAGGRAFCAGGDIRQLYEWGRAKDPAFLDFYREEYRLNACIKRYPKPYVALIDGIVMGGGVGISVHGSHRVAGGGVSFAMPETGIGLFPDVGGTYFLPRMPGQTGMYLALTGARLNMADCVWSGIATHHVASERLGELRQRLALSDDAGKVLGDMRSGAGEAALARQADMIGHIFSALSVEEILARLDALTGAGGDWARQTAAAIRAKSPTSLKITFRQMREGAGLSFEDCMRLEYRMVSRIFTGHDFLEGVRAVIIDKDNAPQWSPAALEQVTQDQVARYFAPLGEQELPLP